MFELFDTRDGRRVSVAVYYDEQRAWRAIEHTKALVSEGTYRQALKDSVAFYSVRLTSNQN